MKLYFPNTLWNFSLMFCKLSSHLNFFTKVFCLWENWDFNLIKQFRNLIFPYYRNSKVLFLNSEKMQKLTRGDLEKYYSDVLTLISLNFMLLNSLISQKYQMKHWLFPGLWINVVFLSWNNYLPLLNWSQHVFMFPPWPSISHTI